MHPADVQDRDGAEPLLRQARRLFPFIERVIGDAGYQGPKMAAAVARTGRWKIEIVRRSMIAHSSAKNVIPRPSRSRTTIVATARTRNTASSGCPQSRRRRVSPGTIRPTE